MSTPYMSEIKIMSFNFPPKGWAQCNGQFLPIAQNQALFSLLGTTYGGNGQTTFALPDMRGNVPMHMGNGFTEGQRGGEASHTLTQAEMPQHVHTAQASSASAGNVVAPTGALLGSPLNLTYAPTANVAMQAATIGNAGGSQPHENMQPYLALNFCIALQGIFPSRN
jgi:microcystin-dependent protein